MSFASMTNTVRPIIFVGKTGTGKTYSANNALPNAMKFFANELPMLDINSLPIDKGIIIEDIHRKPDVEQIKALILNYSGELVLTSINEKDIPAVIKNMCKIKRVGKKNYLRESIKEIAPRSENPYLLEDAMYGMISSYLRETDRDKIAYQLKVNKPADTQILSWLVENIHPNKLIYIDAKVRRKLSSDYFYEMLAYAHSGSNFNRVSFPKRGTYSPIPKICRRFKLKGHEGFLLKQLVKDENFAEFAKTKLDNSECRLLKLGEKKRKKKTDKVIPNNNRNLMEWM